MLTKSLHLLMVASLALALVACGPETSTPADDDDDDEASDDDDDDDDDASDDDDNDASDDDDDDTGSTDDDDDGDDDDDDASSSSDSSDESGDSSDETSTDASSDSSADGTSSESDTSGETELSLAADIQPIFDGSCSCHTKSQPSAGLSLQMGDAHGSLVNKANGEGLILVKPGDPDASYLVNKLNNTQGDVEGGQGQQMPPKDPLSDQEIERIVAWIAGGAKP